jgi:hypothetical protein
LKFSNYNWYWRKSKVEQEALYEAGLFMNASSLLFNARPPITLRKWKGAHSRNVEVAQPEAGQRRVRANLSSIAERLITNQTP